MFFKTRKQFWKHSAICFGVGLLIGIILLLLEVALPAAGLPASPEASGLWLAVEGEPIDDDAPPPVAAPVAAAPLALPQAPPAPVAAPLYVNAAPAQAAPLASPTVAQVACAALVIQGGEPLAAGELAIAARAADGEPWACVFAWLAAVPAPTPGLPINRDQENAAQLRGLIRSHGTNPQTLETALRLLPAARQPIP